MDELAKGAMQGIGILACCKRTKYVLIMKLQPLLKNQHIIIDNHQPGKPFKWDWQEGDVIDDIHLDKSLNQNVNGKKVCIRISLNNDHGVSEPKKCERNDARWMKAYEKMKAEVEDILESNADIREQLVNDVIASIQEIGPKKEKRAIRKAIKRIAKHFGLSDDMLSADRFLKRGAVSLYMVNNEHFYVGFGYDCNFYIGQGHALDFSRRVRPNMIEAE